MNAIPLTRPATDCQVLVVGAGPTGLVLAAELLARGIRTRIIDKGDGVRAQLAQHLASQPLLAGLLALGLFGYLLFALLKAERF